MKKWLLALCLPTVVFAKLLPTPQYQCTPLDLRDQTLGQNRNQHDVAWCYAFTGADMLAHTFNQTERISAADLALGYNQSLPAHLVRWLNLNILSRRDEEQRILPHRTGFNKTSLNLAMSSGWCPERVLPSEEWTKFTREADGSWSEKKLPLKESMLEIASLYQNRHILTPETIPYYFGFKNVDPTVFIQLLQTKKIEGFYSNLRETVCRDDRHAFEYHWKVKMVFKNRKIFRRISEQLEVGRPVGLDYDLRILKDKNHTGVKLGELHTSTIVGRQWNEEKKTCEFLVRDSHGHNCDERYDPSYKCEGGSVWLTESQIHGSMMSVVYMLSGRH